MKIAIMGTGGVGGYFGGRLAASGEEVHFVARGAHLEALRRNGLKIYSPLGDALVKPVRATAIPADIGVADVVVIAVKLWSTEEAIAAIKPIIGANTSVVSFQNGVMAADHLVHAYGKERVLGGVANIAALIEQPGIIRHNGPMAILTFGELSGGRSARAEAFLAACQKAGIDARLTEDIHKALWEKYAFLVALSSMTGLTRLPLGPIREDTDTRRLFADIISEVMDVGRAKGVSLDSDIVDKLMARCDSLPRTMVASMLGDLERGSRLELPWLAGGVVDLGRQHGLATPACRFVCTALKHYSGGRPADARS